MSDFNYPFGCNFHMVTDCGCPGYPTLQTVLRDCGKNCAELPRNQRCLRCDAADMIDRYSNRSDRYLERIIELQKTIEDLSPPQGHISIHVPVDTIERIIETDRMFHALEQLRDAINQAWGAE